MSLYLERCNRITPLHLRLLCTIFDQSMMEHVSSATNHNDLSSMLDGQTLELETNRVISNETPFKAEFTFSLTRIAVKLVSRKEIQRSFR